MEVAYSTGLIVRTEETVRNTMNMKSRCDLIIKFGDADAVDELIRLKTAAGEFMDHPDAPHLLSLRLYYMYSDTEWSNLHSIAKVDEMKGDTNLSAEDLCTISGSSLAWT